MGEENSIQFLSDPKQTQVAVQGSRMSRKVAEQKAPECEEDIPDWLLFLWHKNNNDTSVQQSRLSRKVVQQKALACEQSHPSRPIFSKNILFERFQTLILRTDKLQNINCAYFVQVTDWRMEPYIYCLTRWILQRAVIIRGVENHVMHVWRQTRQATRKPEFCIGLHTLPYLLP